MSGSEQKHFIDLCIEGKASPGEISRFVQEWREKDANESLEAYLGMTEDEYRMWVEDNGNLERIVERRKK